MKHDHLTMDELLHYGQDGVVEGLDAEIAKRFAATIAEDTSQELEDLRDDYQDLKDTVEEIFNLAKGAL